MAKIALQQGKTHIASEINHFEGLRLPTKRFMEDLNAYIRTLINKTDMTPRGTFLNLVTSCLD